MTVEITEHVRFKQPFFTVTLINFLQRKITKLCCKNGKWSNLGLFLFNKIGRYRSHRCSIKIGDRYVFSAIEAKEIRPSKVETFKIKKIRYTDREDLLYAIVEMPDFDCWDKERKVIIKTM